MKKISIVTALMSGLVGTVIVSGQTTPRPAAAPQGAGPKAPTAQSVSAPDPGLDPADEFKPLADNWTSTRAISAASVTAR